MTSFLSNLIVIVLLLISPSKCFIKKDNYNYSLLYNNHKSIGKNDILYETLVRLTSYHYKSVLSDVNESHTIFINAKDAANQTNQYDQRDTLNSLLHYFQKLYNMHLYVVDQYHINDKFIKIRFCILFVSGFDAVV